MGNPLSTSLTMIALTSSYYATETWNFFVKRNTDGSIPQLLNFAADANVGDLRREIIANDPSAINNILPEALSIEYDGNALNDDTVLLSDYGICSESVINYGTDCMRVQIRKIKLACRDDSSSSESSENGPIIPIPIDVMLSFGCKDFFGELGPQIRAHLKSIQITQSQIGSDVDDIVDSDQFCIGYNIMTDDINNDLSDILPKIYYHEHYQKFFVQNEALAAHWIDANGLEMTHLVDILDLCAMKTHR